MESVESDCACALQRKAPENLPTRFDGTLSPVLFEGKTCRIAAIFNDSCSNAALFLCNPDCVAEREGFNSPLFMLTRMNTGDNA
jgi:hypothetical protein